MPSVKNPNKPSKNRLAARRASTKKRAQKSSEAGRLSRIGITKADAARGAKPGLLPTSGPRAALSKKKLKKLEQRVRLATQRAEKAEADKEGGELVMRGEFFLEFFLSFFLEFFSEVGRGGEGCQ